MKKHRWERSKRLNKHHIKNKCKGGDSSPSNLIRLDTERHKAFHFLFGNMDFLEAANLLTRAYQIKNSE